MGNTTSLLLFSLGAAFFLAAGLLISIAYLWNQRKIAWLPLALALFLLSSLCGVYIYRLAINLPGSLNAASMPAAWLPIDIPVFALLLSAAALSLLSALWLKNLAHIEEETLLVANQELQRYQVNFEKDERLLVIKDPNGAYMAVNPAFAAFLGKQEQALKNETDFSFFPRSTANALRQNDERALASDEPLTVETELFGVPGARWFQITRTPLKGAGGEALGLIFSAHDITGEKQRSVQLDAWQRGLAVLLEYSSLPFDQVAEGDLYKALLPWAARLAGTQHIGLWRIQPQAQQAELQYAAGALAAHIGQHQHLGDDLPWKVWRSAKPVYLPDYPTASAAGFWQGKNGSISCIGVPMMHSGQVTHVLSACYETLAAEQVAPCQSLLALLAQATVAYQNLLEKTTSLGRNLEERGQSLSHLQFRIRLEHALAVMSLNFIQLDLSKFDEAVRKSLKTLAQVAGVERAYLSLLPEGMATPLVDFACYDTKAGENPEGLTRVPGDFILHGALPWAIEKLNQLEVVHIPALSALPAEDEQAGAYFKRQQIQSMTVFPLVANRMLKGLLGFENAKADMNWSPDVIGVLHLVADMYANLVKRKADAQQAEQFKQKTRKQIELLTSRGQESAAVSEMSDLLQACRTADEAYPIITRYMLRLLPGMSGALYLFNDEKDPAENVAAWGDAKPAAGEHELNPNECWALRRGRLYQVNQPQVEPVCAHIKEPLQDGYLCIPLMAQGRAAGVLHLRRAAGHKPDAIADEETQRLAGRIAEYIAVSLTNLRLRDELRSQAIRDPLTGLFNRRYMEETLEREIRRAVRHNTTVSVIMFDIDRMKPINDTYGHDAGDLLLKTLGNTLLRMFRGEDVACRYGGDEFVIVLPEASLADVWRRAEHVREAARSLNLSYEGKSLGGVTLSIGVAAYPDHGLNAERVLLAGDAASYAAKSEGGDRIMVGRTTE